VALGQDAEKAFAEAIVEVLKEPKTPPSVLPQFSAPALAKQYISLYRRLISSAVPQENASASASIDVASSERQPL
jgi:hypothetical protein